MGQLKCPLDKKPKSGWQKYFNMNKDNTTAKCKYCPRTLKTCSNTTNLKQHIERLHRAVLQADQNLGEDDFREISNSQTSLPEMEFTSTSKRGRSSIEASFSKISAYAPDGDKNKEITHKIAEMICQDSLTLQYGRRKQQENHPEDWRQKITEMFFQENSPPDILADPSTIEMLLQQDISFDTFIHLEPQEMVKEPRPVLNDCRRYNLMAWEPLIKSLKKEYYGNNSDRKYIQGNRSKTRKRRCSELNDIDEKITPLNEIQNKVYAIPEFPKFLDSDEVQIGRNGTLLTRNKFDKINWTSPRRATRSLLTELFDMNTLGTHSLLGNSFSDFQEQGRKRPRKKRLDENKVADITECVCAVLKCNVQTVRLTISLKCSEAAKKIRYTKKITGNQ